VIAAPDVTTARILIIDDEPANVRLLERVLQSAGYREITSTTDARQAVERFRTADPDLVLLDLMMPHLDGIAVLGQLKGEMRPGDYRPVLVLTADATLDARQRALTAGAADFLTKPFERVEVLLRIRNMLRTRALYRALEEQNRALEETVRERTERLLQSEKIATMGSLLAGVAHELNNPLAVLSGHAQLLHETANDPTLVRRAEKICGATDRCVRIVRNFLALARQRPPERGPVVLKQVLDGVIELVAYQLRTSEVEVTVDGADALPTLWADAHQLHQVLVNLVTNAQQAMRRQSRPRRISITTRHDAIGHRVLLEVADTGPGIPPEIRAKIFDPFFTTKPAGEGTGLGLSLCRGIIEEHGGTIAVESEPGAGTRFIIDLPVGSGGQELLTATESATTPMGPKAILVVDDEPEVATVIAESLAREGHTSDVAQNGAAALDMLKTRGYDLIVSDTKMPVLGGEAFHAELARSFPQMIRRLIFLTGDVLSQEKREFLERAGVPFLVKPFDVGDVRQLVRRVLADDQ
jgi:two-component system NtrC family sensor kinase